MKICAIICEYNPFHNGHKYLIGRAKSLSGCDAVLCIMSASFTQRGEAAVLPKFTRAEHAVKGGADCVIQLPAAFSVAPAEIFAKGAMSILSKIPSVTHIAFGSENAGADDIIKAADIIKDSNFNGAVRKNLTQGQSYKRSLSSALEEYGADSTLVSSPNGILGLEYAKAIKDCGADIGIIPVQRVGSGYGDDGLKENFSSAGAIRSNLYDERVSDNVPDYVFKSLEQLKKTDISAADKRADALVRYALAEAKKEDMTRIFGCSEGLENKLKSDADFTAEEIMARATNRRYTSSRIRRILAANMLGIYSDDVRTYISEGTYIKPLAVRKSIKDEIFSALAESSLPVLIKKMSLTNLSDTNGSAIPSVLKCYRTDAHADFVRALIYGDKPEYDYTVKIIE